MIDERPRPGRTIETHIVAYEAESQREHADTVVTEEPLELRLIVGAQVQTLAVTMRTPGNDFELAAGFVINESIVGAPSDIEDITYCVDPTIDAAQRYNTVNIRIRADVMPDTSRFERHFTMNSACGVCGKANVAAIRDLGIEPIHNTFRIPISQLYELPEGMRSAQRIFARTGGLHAAALFNAGGELLEVREDIGRHNALDKLIGWGAINRRLPFSHNVLCVSGRASYEILQKSAVARIPVVCSVSAPSSLAVELAREFNITLVGFLRGERANVYSGSERIIAG